jgi:hypothetical protein
VANGKVVLRRSFSSVYVCAGQELNSIPAFLRKVGHKIDLVLSSRELSTPFKNPREIDKKRLKI